MSRKIEAVLFDCEADSSLHPLLNYRPIALLRLANKPLLFHTLDKIARIDIKKCNLILHNFPEQIEQITGDHSRWGLSVTHHLVRDLNAPFRTILPALKRSDSELFLFGTMNMLPDLSKEHLFEERRFFNFPNGAWSGWCLLDRPYLEKIDAQMPYQTLSQLEIEKASIKVESLFAIKDAKELKGENRRVLSTKKQMFLFPTESKEVEEGVWISRSVVIEPGVTILAPVFIGENSQVFSGATLGPDTIIESDCIIDANATIINTLICRRSYVGESLDISDSIIDRNILINLTHNTCLSISEEFILSDSDPPKLSHPISHFFQQLIALFLWIIFLPVYGLMRLSYPIRKQKKVKMPLRKNERDYTIYELYSFHRSSRFSWIPTLLNVIRGDLALVGNAPRSREEIEKLPQDWKNLYAKTKAGMITLVDLENVDLKSEDELYATEAYYAVHSGFFYDCSLFLRWLFQFGKQDKRV